jgi:hypothetical protein
MASVIEQRRVLLRSVEKCRERTLLVSRESEMLAEKLDLFATLQGTTFRRKVEEQ